MRFQLVVQSENQKYDIFFAKIMFILGNLFTVLS